MDCEVNKASTIKKAGKHLVSSQVSKDVPLTQILPFMLSAIGKKEQEIPINSLWSRMFISFVFIPRYQ